MSIVKYSTSNVANTIRANNVAVGINNVGYGPTDTTGFYRGLNVPSGGYVDGSFTVEMDTLNELYPEEVRDEKINNILNYEPIPKS